MYGLEIWIEMTENITKTLRLLLLFREISGRLLLFCNENLTIH